MGATSLSDHADGDYGWIGPGPELAGASGTAIWSIERFIEKPGSDVIRTVSNGLLNTFVILGAVRSLLALGWSYVPEVMPLFVELRDSVDRPPERAVLDRIYRVISATVS